MRRGMMEGMRSLSCRNGQEEAGSWEVAKAESQCMIGNVQSTTRMSECNGRTIPDQQQVVSAILMTTNSSMSPPKSNARMPAAQPKGSSQHGLKRPASAPRGLSRSRLVMQECRRLSPKGARSTASRRSWPLRFSERSFKC